MTSSKTHVERLRDIYDETIEDGNRIQLINVEDIDYYSLLCKATASNKIYKMFNCNICSFNCEYNSEDAVIIIFSVPLTTQVKVPDKKHPSEKVMDIIKVVEECFINVDYMNFKEVKEDKFSYVTIIKKTKESEE
jgi:hypothetical protein